MKDRISKNFWLKEFEKSDTAARLGINNLVPNETVYNNLESLVINILQPIADHFKAPVRVNSGYRCPELNAALLSSPKSQHVTGSAADIEVDGVSNYDLAVWIRDNLEFDQLILEFYTQGQPESGWVHVSWNNDGIQRNQALTIGRQVNKHGIHK